MGRRLVAFTGRGEPAEGVPCGVPWRIHTAAGESSVISQGFVPGQLRGSTRCVLGTIPDVRILAVSPFEPFPQLALCMVFLGRQSRHSNHIRLVARLR